MNDRVAVLTSLLERTLSSVSFKGCEGLRAKIQAEINSPSGSDHGHRGTSGASRLEAVTK